MWDKRAAVLAGGEVSEDEEGKEVSTPAERNPKDKDPIVEFEPNIGAETIKLVMEATDTDVELGDQTGSNEDITAI